MNKKLNSLGIAKPPEDTRVVVAMSGGVDSSVSAALLSEEGYDVIGITLKLFDKDNIEGTPASENKSHCTGQDIQDAQRIAEKFGFPHHIINCEDNFRERVIEGFADSYLKGETPIPCVKCNQTIKFGDLLKAAHDLGADCMASGHYIQRITDDSGHAYLMRGKDAGKDQSYFLFTTTQEQLDFLRFPLGGWGKDKTRALAAQHGLNNADKPESQDICFVPDGDYASLVRKLRPGAAKPGKIMHVDGREVGAHKGIIHYTIGQRRGIGIGGGVSENNEPLYVIELRPKLNEIIVGPKEALARDILHIKDCNWLFDHINAPADAPIEMVVKFRSIMNPTPATLHLREGGAEIHLKSPQYGIASGQAAVCYIDDRLIGGGWITGTSNQ